MIFIKRFTDVAEAKLVAAVVITRKSYVLEAVAGAVSTYVFPT
jgi:hypothetical protein